MAGQMAHPKSAYIDGWAFKDTRGPVGELQEIPGGVDRKGGEGGQNGQTSDS